MNLCTIYNYKKHSVAQLDKIKNNKKENTDGLYSYSTSDFDNLNVNTLSESMSVDFDFQTDLDFGFTDEELRKKYPALQDAWEHYNNVLDMCKTREKENED